ncbi:MAG: PHP domain-containing protein [Bacillota bacterium]
MEFFADYHTHTTYSDGRGTVRENVEAALARGLETVGITDHGPKNIGAGVDKPETYLVIKDEVRTLAKEYKKINILVGAEADITGLDGSIDIPKEVVKELDLLIVGLHPFVIPDSLSDAWRLVVENQLCKLSRRCRERVRSTNTKALTEAIHRYKVDIISHPDLKMPVDVPALAAVCARQGVAFEINTGHRYDKTDLIKEAAAAGVTFVVNSDAHFPQTVGELSAAALWLEKLHIPPDMVMNARN